MLRDLLPQMPQESLQSFVDIVKNVFICVKATEEDLKYEEKSCAELKGELGKKTHYRKE